jgi:hypothetical protein
MKRGYRTGWRTWKGPEQGRSAGRPPRACSKELLNLAVVASFRHALSVASLPRLRFVRLVGLPASRMSRATVSASSTLDSMSRLSAPCARVSFEAAKYCEVPAMRPVAPRRSCTNFPSAQELRRKQSSAPRFGSFVGASQNCHGCIEILLSKTFRASWSIGLAAALLAAVRQAPSPGRKTSSVTGALLPTCWTLRQARAPSGTCGRCRISPPVSGGNRAAGTPGYDRPAEYVAERLRPRAPTPCGNVDTPAPPPAGSTPPTGNDTMNKERTTAASPTVPLEKTPAAGLPTPPEGRAFSKPRGW